MKLAPSFIQKDSPAGKAWASWSDAVKAMDDPTPLTYAPDGALRVFRAYFKDQPPNAPPEYIVNTIVDRLKGYRHPRLVVELYVGTSPDQVAEYIPLWKEVTKRLHALGIKVGGPSWYTGSWTTAHMQTLRDAEDEKGKGFCGFDMVFVQGYWGRQGFTLKHALHYRVTYKPGDPPYALVECGFDNVEGGLAGWKLMGLTPAEVADSFMAFDAVIAADAYVVAAFPFVLGPNPAWGWTDFDLEEVVPLLKESEPVSGPDYPLALWRPVGSYGYPLGTHGRLGHLPVAVIYHIMQGYLANCFSLFNNPANGRSAHYGIGKNGAVEQYVSEADAAWGAGSWASPDLSNRFLVDAYAHTVNPNLIAVNVECEGLTGDIMPEAQYASLLKLTKSIFLRNNWPATDPDRYIGHYQVDDVTRANDPGTGFRWLRLGLDMATKPDLSREVAALTVVSTGLNDVIVKLKAI